MEAISSFVWEVLKCAAVPICKRIDYVRNLPKNMEALKDQADSLYAKRNDLRNKIERLKCEKAPAEQGNKWLQGVELIEKELGGIEDKYRAATAKGCGIDWCCNVYSRRKLGQSVEDMMEKIKKWDANYLDDKFLVDLPAPRAPLVPIPSMKAETVVQATLNEIINCLQDKKIRKIGIWGKGGIGKTTIMKKLNNNPQVKGMFDLTIWVTVSSTWTIGKIQKEIVDSLKLKLENKSEDFIARTILEQLEGKKYLLLLDDVWEMIDLVKIGVPNASEDNGNKVVLTTREMRVCREMETNKQIELHPWPENEAWEMFCSKVGEVAMTSKITELAKGVVEECAGLPLALNVVAGMLRNQEDVHLWQDILRELKFPSTANDIDLNEKVYKILKLSYDCIKDKKTKTCFLFCGLYPEDEMIKKSELIRYWHGEGLLLTNGTLLDSYNRGYRVIQDLVDKSLLERDHWDKDDESYVSLHNLMQDMVLRMTASSSHGEQSKHLLIHCSPNPEKSSTEEWESAKRISIIRAGLKDLPNNPKCSTLSTLIIRDTYELKRIPEDFFMHMSELVVFNLSYTRITQLPASVVHLINLKSLLLRNCFDLEALPKEVSAMKKLEVLWVTTKNMKYVPHEVFELPSLKVLKLKSRNSSDPLRPLISSVKWRLKLLEVFAISSNLCKSISIADIRVIAKGLGMLKGLRSLQFDFRTVENLKEFIQGSSIPWRSSRCQILTKFQILINYDMRFDYGGERKKYLAYGGGGEEEGRNNNNNNNNVNMLPDGIREVLACCDCFQLFNHGGVKFLSTLFSRVKNSGRGPKSYIVSGCRAMEKIIENQTHNDDDSVGIFPNLEKLTLRELDNLRSIWDPPKPQHKSITSSSSSNNITSSFSSLRELNVNSCGRLKKMFSWRFLLALSNLTELRIGDCHELKVMISEDEEDGEEEEEITAAVDQLKEAAAPLPKLKILELTNLPEFESLCSRSTSLRWPSLEEIQILICPKLRRFPMDVDDAAALPKLSILILKKLPEFEWFCSSSTNTKEASCCSSFRWPSLQNLSISDCPKLRRLPFNNNDDDDAAALSKLSSLTLISLPEFEWFCSSSTNTKEAASSSSSSSLCWPSLEYLHIFDCPKLRRLPFNNSNIDDNAPNLKVIVGQQHWWDALEWDDDDCGGAAKLHFYPL